MNTPLSLIRKVVKGSKNPGPGPSLCPDEEAFAAYISDSLPKAQKERFERHLNQCEKCLEDLLVFSRVLESKDPVGDAFVTPGMLKEAKDLISPESSYTILDRVVSWSRFFGPVPAVIAGGLALILTGFFIHGLHIQNDRSPEKDMGIELRVTAGAPLAAHSPGGPFSFMESDVRDGEILTEKPKIRVQFKLREEAFVYLLLIHSGRSSQRLFPSQDEPEHVKIAPNVMHIFPENGLLDLGGKRGKMTLHLIASRKPIDNIKRKIEFAEKMGADNLSLAFDSIKIRSFSFIRE